MSALDVIEGRSRWDLIDGDCLEVLPTLPAGSVAHVITDPPYSAVTHAAAAAAAAARDLPDGSKRRVFASGANGFGFDHLPPESRPLLAAEFRRICLRWVVVFTDQEATGAWRDANEGAGLDNVRIGQWVRIGGTPQFSGDRPAQGAEAIVIAHPPGRKRWNGGGKAGVWIHAIAALEAKRGGAGRPEHITPKPVGLMLDLISDFTDPGDLVIDPFAGGGTTGVACLRLGRRFIGIERDPTYAQVARERLAAEVRGLSLRDARSGQTSIFDVVGT